MATNLYWGKSMNFWEYWHNNQCRACKFGQFHGNWPQQINIHEDIVK